MPLLSHRTNTIMERAKGRPIVIRKYGNRRLYDTSASRYINLDELATMVRVGEDVQVVDAKSGEDLTRVTLTQIIVEDAKDERVALPLEVLRELIVASNHAGRDFVMWYLKSAFDAYRKIEKSVQTTALSPLQAMKSLIGAPSDGEVELERLQQRVAELENKKHNTTRKFTARKRTRRKIDSSRRRQ